MAIINGSSSDNTLKGTNNSDIISGNGGNDIINGGGGSDIIFGGTGDDIIHGGSGFDIISGDDGNDQLFGDDGEDILLGGAGNDILDGGKGIDLLTGGSGADLFVLSANMGNDIALDFQVGVDHLRLNGITASQLTLVEIGGSTLVKINNSNGILLLGVSGASLNTLLEGGAVNQPPVIANQTLAILENSSIGQAVGTVAATDPESGPLTYAIVGGSPNFAINATTGVVTVTSNLNYEAQTSYTLQILVTDNQGAASQANLTINIQNVNEAPTDIALSNNSVNENAAAGTVVGSLSATDPDAGDSATFSLVDSAGGRFAISGNQLVTTAPLNYEAGSSYSVTVKVTDSGGLSYNETYTINVNNVNEAPTDIALSNNSVNENAAAGTVVGSLSATDPDAGDSATFSLVDNAGGLFALNGNQIVTTASLNYEAASSYNVTVRATDSSGLTYDETYTINVNNVNEAPTDITLSNTTISNNNIPVGLVVGNLAAIDPDMGDSASFSLLSGTPPGFFSISGNQLVTATNIPAGVFQVTVRATDSGGLSVNKTFTIIAIDPNDAPTDISLSNASVNENATAGTLVGLLSATDPDTSDTASFSLVDSAGGRFAISGNQLVTTAPLNYEEGSSYSVTIRVTDNGGLTYDETFTVNVNNVNEAPVINDQSFSINENSSGGTVVGNLAATDPDAGDNLTYAFVTDPEMESQIALAQQNVTDTYNALLNYQGGGTAISYAILVAMIAVYAQATLAYSNLVSQYGPALFNINSSTGEITVKPNATLNYEATPSIQAQVSVTDSGGLSDQANITIHLNDLPESGSPPTNIVLSNASVNENAAAGTVVGNLAAVDPDANDSATFSLLNNAGGLFAISGNQLVTTTPLDFETQSSYNITVRVTDSSGLTFDKNFTIAVNDVAETNALFTANTDTVNFNNILAGSYVAGTQYDALGGNDTVTLPDIANAAASGFVIGTAFNGGDGNDTIYGGNGADVINGGNGNDIIWGNRGNDTMDGNAGADEFHFMRDGSVQNGTDTILNFQVGQDHIVLENLNENFTFQQVGIVIDGQSMPVSALQLSFGNGDKILLPGVSAGSLNQILVINNQMPSLFTNNPDTVNFNNISSSSYFSGTQYNSLDGNDIITLPNIANAAAAGFLIGQIFNLGAGNDTITGGNGNDVIIGDVGNDIFNMGVNLGNDEIMDFASGADRLNLIGGSGNLVSNIVNNGNTPLLEFVDGGSLWLSGNTLLNTTITNVFENGAATIIRGLDNNTNSITLSGSTNNILWTGAGNDSVILNNTTGNNTIYMEGNPNASYTALTFQGNVSGDNHIILGTGFDENLNAVSFGTGTSAVSGKLTIDVLNGRFFLFNQNSNTTGNTYELYFNGGPGRDLYTDDFHTGLSQMYGNGGNDQLVLTDGGIGAGIGSFADGGSGDDFINLDAFRTSHAYGGTGNDVIGVGAMGVVTSDNAPPNAIPGSQYRITGSHVLEGGEGNDTFINLTNPVRPEFQTFVYNASYDGTTLTANEGTDTIRGPNGLVGFTASKDVIEINVTAAPGTNEADILAQISATATDVNGDGIIDTHIAFGNTAINILGVNAASNLSYIDIHLI